MASLSPHDRSRLLLPPGTRVQRCAGRYLGRVPAYDMSLPGNLGWFPVRWDGGSWETCGISEVIVIPETASRIDAA